MKLFFEVNEYNYKAIQEYIILNQDKQQTERDNVAKTF